MGKEKGMTSNNHPWLQSNFSPSGNAYGHISLLTEERRMGRTERQDEWKARVKRFFKNKERG